MHCDYFKHSPGGRYLPNMSMVRSRVHQPPARNWRTGLPRLTSNTNSCKRYKYIFYILAEHYGYDTPHKEMICIVVGIQDRTCSGKLQLDPTLTLDKAIATVCQAEAVKRQQSIVRRDRQKKILVTESLVSLLLLSRRQMNYIVRTDNISYRCPRWRLIQETQPQEESAREQGTLTLTTNYSPDRHMSGGNSHL